MKYRSILPVIVMLAIVAMALNSIKASPFDPRFIIKVDELCADGDLALSIPLLRVRLDDKMPINIRAEHVLESADYGFCQSNIVLIPLITTIAPYDRDSLIWRKPNGENIILKPSDGEFLWEIPEKARALLETNTYRIFNGRGTVAYVGNHPLAWAVVVSEKFTLCYNQGTLVWFTLPSGASVSAKCCGAMIRKLKISDDLLYCFEQVDEDNA
jgi:hypothetical protein